jgi:predicted transcriptional regulator
MILLSSTTTEMKRVRKQNKPHRSRYEILNEILWEVLLRNQSPSSFYICKLLHIEYGATLTYRQTLDYLPAIVESRLLLKRKTAKLGTFPHYEITDSGRRYLQVFAETQDDLRPVNTS